MALSSSDGVFVTGGSGYIGRNIIRQLVASGHRVFALARSSKSAETVRKLGAAPAQGDLLDLDSLRSGMAEASYLIHAAADTDHGIGGTNQDAANLDGTRNVFQAASEGNVRRAVHLSTEAVLLCGEPLANADESTPYPRSAAGSYSSSKAEAERIALSHSTASLDIIVVRPRFVWGRDDTTALPQLIDAARTGKLSWIGGGRYEVSTTHVANAVHGILLALELGVAGQVYFLADADRVPFRDFVSSMLETQGVAPPTRELPRWLVEPIVRIGDYAARVTRGVVHGPMSWQEYATLGVSVTLNIDKAKRELGYAPIVSREHGLRELRTLRSEPLP